MYAIRITRQFFGQPDRKSYVVDGFDSNAPRAEFKSRAMAEALKTQLESMTYYLAHGESGAPTYKVVRIG